jgi:uncharacterized protein (DUF2267 family)
MAMDLLQQLFGDQGRQQDYDDFLNRAQNNPQSISEQEAAQRYQELMRNAPPELAEEANEAVFNQLPPEMRAQMAQQFRQGHNDPGNSFQGYDYDDDERAADPRSLSRMARTAGTQNPDFLSQLASSPIGRAALAAGAAYLASRVLGGRGQARGGMGGGPFGGMGGGAMGGLGGGSPLGGGALGGAMGGGGGLGGALGGDQPRRSHRRFDGTLGD